MASRHRILSLVPRTASAIPLLLAQPRPGPLTVCSRCRHAPIPILSILSLPAAPRSAAAHAHSDAKPPSDPSSSKRKPAGASSSSSNGRPQTQKPEFPSALRIARMFGTRWLDAVRRGWHHFRSEEFRRGDIRNYPLYRAFVIVLALGGIFFTVFELPKYRRWFTQLDYSIYPRDVAKHIKKALYYGTHAPTDKQNQEKALGHFRAATALLKELGYGEQSNQVVFLKVRIAQWMEDIEQHKGAAELLEGVLGDCMRGVQEAEEELVREMRSEKAGGAAAKRTTVRDVADVDAAGTVPNIGEARGAVELEADGPETPWGKRWRLLVVSVRISSKLGALFADDHVLEPGKAQLSHTWSIQTILREKQRREASGLREGEGAWFTIEDLGKELEGLAHVYESKDQFFMAVPLFFHAQRFCSSPCHRATIMNNLAASFAQHPAHAPFQLEPAAVATSPDETPSSIPQTRAEYLEAAATWAQNAHALASSTQGHDRVWECDQACAIALCHWGEILSMMGRREEARRKLEEARGVSERIDYLRGVRQVKERLEVLDRMEGKR